ncbi:enoyl-CoA hydratase/isomerase family protein [Usitatibacter palustris]|uniref:Fatty acid oxidation complex subunit alpha n=1 Tax=Usitatibacter palustris TaxID=2732487 RepID=A0A6M4H9V3_9PROT|nr:enoyl-CoA hydratase/isomerase family protein [Usitatibacter palustris]QJR16549.1 Fatty acid oxidation complex subunit alpha [Usitatibacter palustris]
MMVSSTKREGIAALGLERPEKGNALSAEMVADLHAALVTAIGDPDVHTVVFRGAGTHFCTGFDLSALETETDDSLAERFIALEKLLQAVWHAPVRTVAVAQGRTWGAGADLFASCDVRVAGADTNIRFPGSAFGIVLGTRRLAELIGWDRARPFVTEGASCNALEALRAGIATRIGIEAWLAESPPPVIVDRETHAAIRAVARGDHRVEDLASLERSARRPGLRQRIVDYRARLKK